MRKWIPFLTLLCAALAMQPNVVALAAPGQTGLAAGPMQPAHAVLWQRMAATIEARAAHSDSLIAATVVDLSTGTRYSLRGDLVFAVASTIKLTLLAELLRQSEAGTLRLSDPLTLQARDVIPGSPILSALSGPHDAPTSLRPYSLRELVTFMITTSDNTATNALIDRLGMPAVNALCSRLGLAQTRLRRRMLDGSAVRAGNENTSTTHELATLLATLYGPQLLSEGTRRDLLHILAQPKDSYFARGLPDEQPLASKPGSLDGLRAEAGIVLLPGRPFVVSAIAAYVKDGPAAEQALADIAAAAFAYFSATADHTVFGRRRPAAQP